MDDKVLADKYRKLVEIIEKCGDQRVTLLDGELAIKPHSLPLVGQDPLQEAKGLLEESKRSLRATAARVGPLHSDWDLITDIDSFLKRQDNQ